MRDRMVFKINYIKDNKNWVMAYGFNKPKKLDIYKMKQELCNMIDVIYSCLDIRFKDDDLLNVDKFTIELGEGTKSFFNHIDNSGEIVE